MSGQFDLANRVKINNPYSNVDIYYGPWDSVEIACANVPIVIRKIGLTVGVIQNGIVIEYWWNSALTDADLVQKIGTVLMIEYGLEKKTGINPGGAAFGGSNMSITDDFIYICVTPGTGGVEGALGTSVWKKFILFQT